MRAGGQDLGAHADDATEVEGGEAEGVEEADSGFEVRERGGDDRRVGGDEGEVVEADGVEKEELLAEEGDLGGFGGLFCKCDGGAEGGEEGPGAGMCVLGRRREEV